MPTIVRFFCCRLHPRKQVLPIQSLDCRLNGEFDKIYNNAIRVSSQYVSNDRDGDGAGWLHDPPGTRGAQSEDTAVVTHAPDTEDYYGWRHWMGVAPLSHCFSCFGHCIALHCRGLTKGALYRNRRFLNLCIAKIGIDGLA